jgi:hypothetical protein
MATRYKDRITILEDAEIEELYGRPRFTHDERVHYFAQDGRTRGGRWPLQLGKSGVVHPAGGLFQGQVAVFSRSRSTRSGTT